MKILEGFHPGVFRGVCLIGFCDFFARVPPRGMGGANFARLSEFSEVPGTEEGGLLLAQDLGWWAVLPSSASSSRIT